MRLQGGCWCGLVMGESKGKTAKTFEFSQFRKPHSFVRGNWSDKLVHTRRHWQPCLFFSFFCSQPPGSNYLFTPQPWVFGYANQLRPCIIKTDTVESFIFWGKACQIAGKKGPHGALPHFLISDCGLRLVASSLLPPCCFLLLHWGASRGSPCLPLPRPEETLGLSTKPSWDGILSTSSKSSYMPRGRSSPSF